MLTKSKKRKEIKKQQALLKIINKNLSTNFKKLEIKSEENLSGLADIALSKHGIACAKLCEDNTIHIKIENAYGFVYEGFTDNYDWFLKTFGFNEN